MAWIWQAGRHEIRSECEKRRGKSKFLRFEYLMNFQIAVVCQRKDGEGKDVTRIYRLYTIESAEIITEAEYESSRGLNQEKC